MKATDATGSLITVYSSFETITCLARRNCRNCASKKICPARRSAPASFVAPAEATTMRFIITAGPGDTKVETESAIGPDGSFDEKLFSAYMKFNEEMHRAGVLVASEGLTAGAKGARVGVERGKRRVLDGPFAETKELVGGFY